MNRVKYQHYVPRFYLDGFKSNSGKLWCYDKLKDKSFQQSPDRLGGETLFYDTPEADKTVGIAQFLEKWFHPLETDAAATLKEWRRRLSSDSVFSPSDEEREVMAFFLVIQFMRTPSGRKSAVEASLMAQQISFFNFLGEKAPDLARQIKDPFDALKFEMKKDREVYAQAQHLLDAELVTELAGILMGHIWLVAENTTRWTYYTSDHPVIRTPHVKHPVRSMSGLGSRGVQIIYPLTPVHSLYLFERTFWMTLSRFDGKVLNRPCLKENIEFDNSLHVCHSHRFIYSRDGDFALAKDMCRQHPELKDLKRPAMIRKR
jgi:hypothetical protein